MIRCEGGLFGDDELIYMPINTYLLLVFATLLFITGSSIKVGVVDLSR
jgi:hypothetical protein